MVAVNNLYSLPQPGRHRNLISRMVAPRNRVNHHSPLFREPRSEGNNTSTSEMPSPTLTVCPLGVDSGQGGIMASRVSCSSGSNCFLACGDSVVHVDLTAAALFQDSAAASAGASAAPPSPDSDAGGGVIRPHLAESTPGLWRVVPTAAGKSMRRGGLQGIVARETTTGDGRILVASVDAFGSVQMQTLLGGGGGGGEEKGEGEGGGGEQAWSDAVCVASPACAGSGFEPGWHGVDMLVKDGQQSVQVGYGCGVVWGVHCGRGFGA